MGNGISIAAIDMAADSRNWLIFLLYVRGEIEDCQRQIEAALMECDGLSDFPNFIQGLILRQQGKLPESLLSFKKAYNYKPALSVFKEIGRSYFLLGKTSQAVSTFDRALSRSEDDWLLHHQKGLCLAYRGESAAAIECFRTANLIEKHDATFLELGRAYTRLNDIDAAIDVYLEALAYSPENTEVLTQLGLMYLQKGNAGRAFEFLGTALSLDKWNADALIASGSMLQEGSEHDAALMKYRIIAAQMPNSSRLWNNIGMCFYDKGKHIAAIACLKRSQYLDPFQAEVSYNLGLVHLATTQYASAFNFFKSAVSLDPSMSLGYMCLGITLCRLKDYPNAIASYDKAMSLDPSSYTAINYALTLVKANQLEKARTVVESIDRQGIPDELSAKLKYLREVLG